MPISDQPIASTHEFIGTMSRESSQNWLLTALAERANGTPRSATTARSGLVSTLMRTWPSHPNAAGVGRRGGRPSVGKAARYPLDIATSGCEAGPSEYGTSVSGRLLGNAGRCYPSTAG